MSDRSLETWESEGGRLRGRFSKVEARRRLSEVLPEMVYSEMDGGVFWKSLIKPRAGDIIEHEGKKWVVRYSWRWTAIFGISVYFSELDPAEGEIR